MNRYFLFILLTLCSCNVEYSSKVKDIANKEAFEFSSSKDTYLAEVSLKGNVDCNFKLDLFLDKQLNHSYDFNYGQIDTILRFDWYGGKLGVEYLPNDCKKGSLSIDCRFYD